MTTLFQSRDEPIRLVVINAGVSDPSSTRMLADRIAQKSLDRLSAAGFATSLSIIDLAPLAVDIAKAIVAGFPGEKVQAAIDTLARADAVIAATPVYKAGISGLFKSFIDLIDNDLLIAKPVVLAATAGTARHAMVGDEQMRPLFAFLRAMAMPTSVFAAPEDWAAPELGTRIDRVAGELTQFVASGVGRAIADAGWNGYQHQFGGNAIQAERKAEDVNLDTDLMRLAAGGSLSSEM
ncbi:CE1759 family FMN reductase [Paradevosia shaoguanensis]|uniref:CE1759 family FMN reductase n=1 Tax=Paradevosia shaoguanensis TaxID=1335043 RepID=UPI00193298C3|nr:CE1759 family FMN reductase [Paradevosia shaoguanensis]